MSRKRLIERLKWYYPVERIHAFVTFPALLLYSIYSNSVEEIIFLMYGLIVCIVILYQGQHYWKLKLKRLKGEEFDAKRNIRFFFSSKKINQILISLIPAFFLIQLSFQNWSMWDNKMLFWGILANVFAVLEHINYYHTQLMIDNQYDLQYVIRNRRLKKASLAKNLAENKL